MKKDIQDRLRAIPAVDDILNSTEIKELSEKYGRVSVVSAVRESIQKLRRHLVDGEEGDVSLATIIKSAGVLLENNRRSNLRSVINATGIILHTGLGRAVMPETARMAMFDRMGCCDIQLDLETGTRKKRESCIADIVCQLTGAEDALVVNNNAGATMLVLKALSEGKEVIVSRGELIEIGGSFRLPDIMAQSGAILREVGATNKTHAHDYADAVSSDTGILLKVHKSNYEVVGFAKEVNIEEIVEIGKKKNIPVVDDMGCGALVDLEAFWY